MLQLASHSDFSRGGALQMLELAGGLALRGHHVCAALNRAERALDSKHPGLESARMAGVVVISVALDDPATLRACWKQGLGGQPFQVLHTHRSEALLAAHAALGDDTNPAWIAQRGTTYLPRWFSSEHRLLCARRVGRVIAVSHAVRRGLIWKRGVPARKIEVVYGSVDRERFNPAVSGLRLRLQFGVPAGTCVITLPGALIPKKAPADFLHAAARVRRQRQGVRFWIVGKGKLEAELRGLAEALELGAMVDFLGHQENMPEVYAASDLVICCAQRGEGLTGTLREALAMARPVITTRVAGNTELVEDNVTGYVTPPGQPAQLAEAMLRVLNDAGHAGALARNGLARVTKLCCPEKRAERVEEIYRQVLGTR